jgi:tetratricopeptide (TPR) repeat protein
MCLRQNFKNLQKLEWFAGDRQRRRGADCFVERALVLNPNLAAAWGYSGWVKMCLGELDTAIEHEARAMRLSPLEPRIFVWQSYTAQAHMQAGRYDAAAAWAENALREQEDYANPRRIAAASYALAGRLAEARKHMARLRQLDPTLRISNLGDRLPPHRRPEHRANYVEGLRKAGLPE